MSKISVIFIGILLISSCLSEKEPKNVILNFNDKEKATIEQFSRELRDSINNYSVKFFVTSFDQTTFDAKFSKEPKIAKNILNNFLAETVRKKISLFQLNFIDRLSENKGKVKLTRINHKGIYTDISFAVSYLIFVDFIKFRIELVNHKPKITDIFSFRFNDWFSNSLKKDLKLNIKYKAGSTERRQSNIALLNYTKAIENEDYLMALMSLNQIPKTHINDFLNHKKLNAAININEDSYRQELDKCAKNTKNLRISYLYATFYQDSAALNNVCEKLTGSIGKCDEINKLKKGEVFWQ